MIYELLIPLYHLGYIKRFWHYTTMLVTPPRSRYRIVWKAPPATGQIVFILVLGRPRDYDTKEPVITTDYGFWHSHQPMMRLHWDPAVESIYEFSLHAGYPHYIICEKERYLDIIIVNDTEDITVMQDVSVYILEYDERHKELIDSYMRGIVNLLVALGRMRVEEVSSILEGLARLARMGG